jgi:hypothetical protein
MMTLIQNRFYQTQVEKIQRNNLNAMGSLYARHRMNAYEENGEGAD